MVENMLMFYDEVRDRLQSLPADQPLAMIALDVSRLLSRAGRGTPTGIDRVELAYAEHFIANAGVAYKYGIVPSAGSWNGCVAFVLWKRQTIEPFKVYR